MKNETKAKIKNALDSAGKWCRKHKKGLTISAVGTGIILVLWKSGDLFRSPAVAKEAMDIETVNIPVGPGNEGITITSGSAFGQLNDGNLPMFEYDGRLGYITDYWMEDGFPNAIMISIRPEDLGEVGKLFVENGKDIIDPNKAVQIVATFNTEFGD